MDYRVKPGAGELGDVFRINAWPAVDPPRAFVSRRAAFVGMTFTENRHPLFGVMP